jgi:hypothetical protein
MDGTNNLFLPSIHTRTSSIPASAHIPPKHTQNAAEIAVQNEIRPVKQYVQAIVFHQSISFLSSLP